MFNLTYIPGSVSYPSETLGIFYASESLVPEMDLIVFVVES